MAAQPPRPPPNNLLFSGPPPFLPRVVLLPSDSAVPRTTCDATLHAVLDQSNDADDLDEINNVGVPTYDEPFSDQESKHVFDNDPADEQYMFNFIRRTRSFDISDIYVSTYDYDLDESVFRHRRSEPDLSKYALFVEAEVPMPPLQPPPLVLNNPFYNGAYALAPNDLSENVVVLPENYLAFEDSFVPSWEYKPEMIVNPEINPGLYYDGLPLIPPNDPWSAFGNQNNSFQYYTPQFEIPSEEAGVEYMRLSDLEYANIPQYMNLPEVESTQTESCPDKIENIEEEKDKPSGISNNDNITRNTQDNSTVNVPLDPVVNEEDKLSAVDSNKYRDSSRSEDLESFNADISYDVTSSLAYMPSSKSSQRECGSDDTSDDTSPCSTDYHEASALDLAQSLDDLSCCDSTDFSQSRDETSPLNEDLLLDDSNISHSVNKEECNGPNALTPVASLPLSKLPSIPLQKQLPQTLPPVPINFKDSERTLHSASNSQCTVVECEPVMFKSVEDNNNKTTLTKAIDVSKSAKIVSSVANDISKSAKTTPSVASDIAKSNKKTPNAAKDISTGATTTPSVTSDIVENVKTIPSVASDIAKSAKTIPSVANDISTSAKVIPNVTIDKTAKPVTPNVTYVNSVDIVKSPPAKQRPQPPTVPPAWLTKTNQHNVVNKPNNAVQGVPQILVHNAEGEMKQHNNSAASSAQRSVVVNPPVLEHQSQPSCSYAPAQPLAPQPSQLKPDKQPKEVEVSRHVLYNVYSLSFLGAFALNAG